MLLTCMKNALLVLPIAWLGTGCAMYSETRDKQGKALQEAYSKVDLKGQFEVPRKNRANILAQQLATVDALESVRREGMIRTVAAGRSDKDTVVAQLNAMSALSGADEVLGHTVSGDTLEKQLASRSARSAALKTWTQHADAAQVIRNNIRNIIEPGFIRQAVAQPTCKDIRTESKAKQALDKIIDDQPGSLSSQELRASLIMLTKKCSELKKEEDGQLATKIGGALAKVQELIDKEETDYRNLKGRTEAERTAAKAALAERDQAEEKGDGDGVAAAAAKVEALLKKIKQAEDVFSIQFISDQEQDALNEFLTTLKETQEGKAPKAGSSKAAIALALFPKLMKDAQEKLDDAGKASLTPLILQKNISQIMYDAATRDIETRSTRISLLKQQEAILLQQVRKYTELDDTIAKMDHRLLRMPMTVVLAAPEKSAAGKSKAFEPSIDDKISVWRSLATYTDQGTRAAGEVAKIGFKLNALESEILLGYAEANVTQWDALISSNVSQLATFGGAGIKVEQITALINSVSLLWIGAGVH